MGPALRASIALLTTCVALLGGVVAYRLHRTIAAQGVSSSRHVDEAPLVSVERIQYEVIGPAQTVGHVGYLDANAQAYAEPFTSLPWSHTLTAASPGVFAFVVAQGNSDTIGCRVIINGHVEQEQSVTGHPARAACLLDSRLIASTNAVSRSSLLGSQRLQAAWNVFGAAPKGGETAPLPT
ncbi:hypothetical protein K883_05172 [Mycobacterium sp. TKK-01-0059]|nr:hypothetical protein K883_05172 [Mycobacterium sp. TKK-01-0059]